MESIGAPILEVNRGTYTTTVHHFRMKTTFGERVAVLRKKARIKTPTALAKRVLISQPSMRAIELGDTDPAEIKLGTFMRLVDVLKTSPEYLWSGQEPQAGPIQISDEILRFADRITRMSDQDRKLLDSIFAPEKARK